MLDVPIAPPPNRTRLFYKSKYRIATPTRFFIRSLQSSFSSFTLSQHKISRPPAFYHIFTLTKQNFYTYILFFRVPICQSDRKVCSGSSASDEVPLATSKRLPTVCPGDRHPTLPRLAVEP